MKNTHFLAGTLAGLVALTARADLLTLEAHAVIEDFAWIFDSADQFPFQGLQRNDEAHFRIQYDTEMEPTLIDGMLAHYELDPGASSIQLEDNIVSFDTAILRVGVNSQGRGIIYFNAHNIEHAFESVFQISGPSLVSMDLPQSLDFDQFTTGNIFYADPDVNKMFYPLVLGRLTSAEVIPAPSSIFIAGVCTLATTRRRRPSLAR